MIIIMRILEYVLRHTGKDLRPPTVTGPVRVFGTRLLPPREKSNPEMTYFVSRREGDGWPVKHSMTKYSILM